MSDCPKYMSELGAEVTVVRHDQVQSGPKVCLTRRKLMKIPWRIPGLAFKITVEECVAMDPDRIMISPGPGSPKGALTACQSRIQTNNPHHSPCNVDAGISCDVIRTFAGKKPIFGVCLGIPIYYYMGSFVLYCLSMLLFLPLLSIIFLGERASMHFRSIWRHCGQRYQYQHHENMTDTSILDPQETLYACDPPL